MFLLFAELDHADVGSVNSKSTSRNLISEDFHRVNLHDCYCSATRKINLSFILRIMYLPTAESRLLNRKQRFKH